MNSYLVTYKRKRGREVYVFKPEHFDKAVIIDEKEDDDG